MLKRYVVDASSFTTTTRVTRAPIKTRPGLLQFGTSEGGPRMPMPAASVRVYHSDSKGGVRSWEDRIVHTRKMGLKNQNRHAFDVILSAPDVSGNRPLFLRGRVQVTLRTQERPARSK